MNADRLWTRGILALGIVLLLVPFTVRVFAGEPLVPGSESYGHLRIAGIIAGEGFLDHDPAMPERALPWNVFHVLLAGFILLLGDVTAGLLAPFLLGIGTLWCLFQATRRWNLSKEVARGVQAVFVLSPLFVDAFAQVTPRSLELFMLMLFLVLIAPGEHSRVLRLLCATLIAALASTFGIVQAAVFIIMPAVARSLRRGVHQSALISCVVAFIVLITLTLPSYLQEESPAFGQQLPVIRVVSDFGAPSGLSLFAWLLAFVGLISLWHLKRRYYAAMLASSLALVVALFAPDALVVAQVLVAFLAGYALAFFAQMRWLFDDIKTLTLFVLVCGLLFSTLAHAVAISQGPPQQGMMQAALKIRDDLPKATVILSNPDDGFLFAYWTGAQVHLDGWLEKTPGVNERWQSAQAIWHAQDIARVRPLLFKEGIGALVITEEMRKGKVWELPEQDLLFLLRNYETFKNVYHSDSVDIWAVKQPGAT